MAKQFEVNGVLTQLSTLNMKIEPYVVMVSNDKIGRSLSIYCEGLDLGFQIPITDEILKVLKEGD